MHNLYPFKIISTGGWVRDLCLGLLVFQFCFNLKTILFSTSVLFYVHDASS